jgi:hypothetical protein
MGNGLFRLMTELKLKPDYARAFAPIPMEPAGFTLDEIQELSWTATSQNQLPVFMLLSENDRIVDNDKVQQFLGHMFLGETRNRLITCDSGHAFHFEMPEKVTGEIIRFIDEN